MISERGKTGMGRADPPCRVKTPWGPEAGRGAIYGRRRALSTRSATAERHQTALRGHVTFSTENIMYGNPECGKGGINGPGQAFIAAQRGLTTMCNGLCS